MAAGLVGLWAFFFAVRPVWSASEQMQAQRDQAPEAQSPQDVIAPVPTRRVTWEQAVVAFNETYRDVPVNQSLTAFEGVEPKDFFRMRVSPLISPEGPQYASGLLKLYMIPNKAFFFRLEDFEVPPGPDYEIALTTAQAPRTGQDVRASKRYQYLTTMENFRGNRNILINPDVLDRPDQRPTRFNSLVIWNPEYNVVVATASLD